MKFNITSQKAAGCARRLSLCVPALDIETAKQVIAEAAGYADLSRIGDGPTEGEATGGIPVDGGYASWSDENAEPTVLAYQFADSLLKRVRIRAFLNARKADDEVSDFPGSGSVPPRSSITELLREIGLMTRSDTETLPMLPLDARQALVGEGCFVKLLRTNALELSTANVAWTESDNLAYFGYVVTRQFSAPSEVSQWLMRRAPGHDEIARRIQAAPHVTATGISESTDFVQLQQRYLMCAEDDRMMHAAVCVDFDVVASRKKNRALLSLRLCGDMDDTVRSSDRQKLAEAVVRLLSPHLNRTSWIMAGADDAGLDIIVAIQSETKPSPALRAVANALGSQLSRHPAFELSGAPRRTASWSSEEAFHSRITDWLASDEPGMQLEIAANEQASTSLVGVPASKFRPATRVRAADRSDVTLPERVCMRVSELYPRVLSMIDAVRASPERFGMPGKWAPWCYIPVNIAAGALAQAAGLPLHDVEQNLSKHVRLSAQAAAWRMTKSVYCFDKSLLSELVDSDAKDGLPDELFKRLPDWAPYIATPGLEIAPGAVLHGFFISVDDHAYGGHTHPPELQITILIDPRLSSDTTVLAFGVTGSRDLLGADDIAQAQEDVSHLVNVFREAEWLHATYTLDLERGSFKEGIAENLGRSPAFKKSLGLEALFAEKMADPLVKYKQVLLKLASIALYLCSDEPDITPNGYRNGRQEAIDRARKLRRAVPEQKVRQWEVGYRIGAALRAWQSSVEPSSSTSTGSRKRPHVRRAHWHTYVEGPRDDPDKQIRRVRWLPPIPINARSADDLVPTKRDVETE
jgi:hypothetical protein